MSLRAALALLACLALLAGCGSSHEQDGTATNASGPSQGGDQAPQVIVQTASPGFDTAKIYREAAPGVVTVHSIFEKGAGEGSGFVLDEDGTIVTNAHVITDELSGPRKPAKEVFIEFADRNIVEAEIVGFDPFADVGLLKIDPDGLDLNPLELGRDADVEVGQPVVAIGSPFGEQQSLSSGIVSATDRSVRSLTQFQIEGAIQTDASINPGNSGGPLLDAAARVIGINQQIETESGANDGVGFAVPVSAVKRSIAQLAADGSVEYAYIGVSSQALYPQLAEKLGLDTTYGGLLADVVRGGPAEKAGLQGGDDELRFQAGEYKVGGDVILTVDGRRIVEPDDLSTVVAFRKPGDTVPVVVLRDGERKRLEVTLGKRPDDAGGG
ncbi:MAG TPA: trypsin-like peptidase domain-containing protein [Solirubrobacterales bacterium]|nr:trypsin-like peptidase domain-containing protein [Solirubrobacterales bacterium]